MANTNTEKLIQKNIVNDLKDRSENSKASIETGLVNEKTGSSILLDRSGNISLTPSTTVQYKLQYATGHSTEISIESNTITNRKNIIADEIVFNKHKFNPQFYELTNMKRYLNDETRAIGNLTICGTVLVKAWDQNLEKWVLIRRPIRTPMFSNSLNLPSCPAGMDIEDNITDYINQMNEAKEKLK